MKAETDKTKNGECSKAQEEQNYGKAVAAGFNGDLTEQEVEQMPGETIQVIGMSIENVKITCPAKPITYVFLVLNDDDEKNKYVRSANM